MKKMGKTKKVSRDLLTLMTDAAPWLKIKGLESRLQMAAWATFAHLPEALLPAAKKAGATVLLTTDRMVCGLNHDYRGMKKPTNVLSFPQFTRSGLRKEAVKAREIALGDIAVAYATTAKEAKAEGKILLDHLTHLVIHGLLHLFGYDHLTDGTARRMEQTERKIMDSLGLPDPYAETAPRVVRRRAAKKPASGTKRPAKSKKGTRRK